MKWYGWRGEFDAIFPIYEIQQNMMNKDIREATGDRVDICHLNTDS